MSKWSVQFFTGNYDKRQIAANKAGAIVYLEGHANSSENSLADYGMALVASNASPKSQELMKAFAKRFGDAFSETKKSTTRIGGRGEFNLQFTKMPAVILEPCFASNHDQAVRMESEEGLNTLAGIIARTVREFFPDGGLVAFSIGHIGKDFAPHDRGAHWCGKKYETEADFATEYMHRAAELLAHGE